MSSKAMSLKGKIKNYAKSKSIAAQVVLQNYMFERFLARLSMSDYREKFVVKGGMLIAAIVGLDTRSTMDLDTTLRNLPLTEEKVMEAVENICKITLGDDVIFEVKSIAPIRKDDRYGGFCVRLDAIYDTIVTPLSIDVSTGDVITPEAVEYEFSGIFDEEIRIKMWGYNIESVMAEKVETILSRGTADIYHQYWSDNMIVIVKLITEAPKGQEKSWHTRLEKLLVDIMSEPLLLASISESEYPGVYMDAFARYYIDENCLFRYANRRKSAKKIKKLLHDKTDIILKTKE